MCVSWGQNVPRMAIPEIFVLVGTFVCVHVCVCVDETEVYFKDCHLTPLVSQVFVPDLNVLRD